MKQDIKGGYMYDLFAPFELKVRNNRLQNLNCI